MRVRRREVKVEDGVFPRKASITILYFHVYRNSLFFVAKIFSYAENVRKYFTRI